MGFFAIDIEAINQADDKGAVDPNGSCSDYLCMAASGAKRSLFCVPGEAATDGYESPPPSDVDPPRINRPVVLTLTVVDSVLG